MASILADVKLMDELERRRFDLRQSGERRAGK
jgi:hypothetical protein